MAEQNNFIKITAKYKTFTDEMIIRFNPQATELFDNKLDAYKLFTTDVQVPQIFSLIAEHTPSSINTLSDFDENLVILVGFKAMTAGEYSLTVNDFDLNGYSQIYLKDTYTNTINKLDDLTYAFHSEVGQFNDRFQILFSISASVNELSSNVEIYSHKDVVYVKANSQTAVPKEIEVINSFGQTVVRITNNNKTELQIPVKQPSGAYIVKIVTQKQAFSRKVIIFQD